MPADSHTTSSTGSPWDCPACGSAAVDPGRDQPIAPHYTPGQPYQCSASGVRRHMVIAIYLPHLLPLLDEARHD